MPVLYQGKVIAGNDSGGVSDIQTKIEGSPGQVVGFDASGNAAAIQGWSNPNLLVNWDFRNPINSQGKTTYMGAGMYTIDNWLVYETSTISVSNTGITLTSGAKSNSLRWIHFVQTVDIPKPCDQLTFSVLFDDYDMAHWYIEIVSNTASGDSVYLGGKNVTSKLTTLTGTVPANYDWANPLRIVIACDLNNLDDGETSTCKVIAAKLEFGNQQTLAHKVRDTWILNDVAPCLPIEMLRMGYRWCNPNLLDNWYFVNPVNQRLKTTYTENNGRIIDRWKLGINNASNAKYDVTNHKLSCDLTNSGYVTMSQTIDHPELFANNTLTFSVLSSSASRGIIQLWRYRGESVIAIAASKTWSNDVFTTITFQYSDILPTDKVRCIIETQDHFDVVAAKLELGPIQTLAHKEDDTWVLNEIPNYGEELRKCQRYYFKTSDAQMESISAVALDSTTLFCWARFPTTMRANIALSNVIARNAETGETITGLTTVSLGPNGIAKLSKSEAFTAGKFYQLSYEASAAI